MRTSHLQAPHTGLEKYLDPKRVLLLVCFLILAIIAIRFYHISVTGYMLPDESYYEKTVLDHKLYEGRELFSVILRSLLRMGGQRPLSHPCRGRLYHDVGDRNHRLGVWDYEKAWDP